MVFMSKSMDRVRVLLLYTTSESDWLAIDVAVAAGQLLAGVEESIVNKDLQFDSVEL